MSALPLPIALLLAASGLFLLVGFAAAIADSLFRRKTRVRRCSRCGCTDAESCPGGCWWISFHPPICSRCPE